jgi:hypothetical protein
VSKKGDHVLLRRLLVMTQRRLPFTQRVERYQRQRQWLIDLEHLLDPEREPPKTSTTVSQAVDRYLVDLTTRSTLDTQDRPIAARINQVFRNFWWGLFACYNVEGLPRTNNELERFIRQIKMGQRRVSGQKNVHNFILRYGAYAALIDETESQDDLLVRLEQVDQEEFLKERKRLNLSLLQEQKLYRFRFHRADYLAELEARWAAAVDQTNSHLVS